MHNVDIDLVEMSLDVIKFAIGRISDTDPQLGFPKTAAELRSLVGETITPAGIGIWLLFPRPRPARPFYSTS